MHRINPKATYVTILGAEGFARGLLFAALVSYWVVQARLDPLQLVLLGTALEAALFVFQVPTGVFADTFGRRPATAIGYVGLGIGLGLQALTHDFTSLLLLQAFSGVAWAFLIGSIDAWIAEHEGTENLETVFMRGGQADLAGLMVGLCVTVAAGQVDARLPILSGGAMLVSVGVAAAVLMREGPRPRADGTTARWRHLVATAAIGAGRIRTSRTLLLLVLVALALGVSSEGWDRLYAAHLMRDLGLQHAGSFSPVGWLALIGLASSGLGLIAFQIATHKLGGPQRREHLAALYLSRAALMLSFALAPWLPVAIIAFLAGETLRRLANPLIDAWIARETPAEVRATVLSVVGQADSLGQIAAGPLIGLLGSLVSIPAALVASAALMVPAAGLVAVAKEAKTPLDLLPDKGPE